MRAGVDCFSGAIPSRLSCYYRKPQDIPDGITPSLRACLICPFRKSYVALPSVALFKAESNALKEATLI
jgi:hypothetical protein